MKGGGGGGNKLKLKHWQKNEYRKVLTWMIVVCNREKLISIISNKSFIVCVKWLYQMTHDRKSQMKRMKMKDTEVNTLLKIAYETVRKLICEQS